MGQGGRASQFSYTATARGRASVGEARQKLEADAALLAAAAAAAAAGAAAGGGEGAQAAGGQQQQEAAEQAGAE